MAWLFENCFPSALDTTVDYREHGGEGGELGTFVITGDIDPYANAFLADPNGTDNHCLAKSISDVSWSMFRSILVQKAASAVNRSIVEVNPRYTPQMCSKCGNTAKKSLSVRWHECQKCGFSLECDRNTAIDIASLGQQSLPASVG